MNSINVKHESAFSSFLCIPNQRRSHFLVKWGRGAGGKWGGGGGGAGGGGTRGEGFVRMNYLVTDCQTSNSLLQNHEKGRVRSCSQTDSSLLQNNIMKMLAFMFSSPAIRPGYVTTSNYRVVIVSFGRLIASGVL